MNTEPVIVAVNPYQARAFVDLTARYYGYGLPEQSPAQQLAWAINAAVGRMLAEQPWLADKQNDAARRTHD